MTTWDSDRLVRALDRLGGNFRTGANLLRAPACSAYRLEEQPMPHDSTAQEREANYRAQAQQILQLCMRETRYSPTPAEYHTALEAQELQLALVGRRSCGVCDARQGKLEWAHEGAADAVMAGFTVIGNTLACRVVCVCDAAGPWAVVLTDPVYAVWRAEEAWGWMCVVQRLLAESDDPAPVVPEG